MQNFMTLANLCLIKRKKERKKESGSGLYVSLAAWTRILSGRMQKVPNSFADTAKATARFQPQ
jgi:hypothetical protein